MNFEKNNDIKNNIVDIPRHWKPNISEHSEKKVDTEDLFKKVDRMVSHTIKENKRSDVPLTSGLSLKELAPLMKGADIGQIIQCTVRFETQKFMASPVDYLTEKDLEALKIGAAIHFGSFIIAIDKDTIHEFLVSVIDKSAVAELLGIKEELLVLENTRNEIISYVEETIYESIRAANYLALCMVGGVLKVGEYIFDFTAGTVLMFAKPQLAEALYKKDFSGELMEAIDKAYGENDFLIKVGDVVENVGSVAAFMGLCALAAPETIVSIGAILPGAALYFAAESGKNIKNLVSESGELSGEEYFLGCVNGAISVCFLYLLPALSDVLKKYANAAIPKVWDTLVKHGYSEKITRDTIAKIIGSSYGAARGGLQTVLNEAANIVNEELAKATGFKEEAEIDWKRISFNIVTSMVIGAASYAMKDLLIGSHWTSIERERMHQETGWSYEFIDSLESEDQYERYKNLVEKNGWPPPDSIQDIADNVAKQYNEKINPTELAKQKGYLDVEPTKNGGISYEKSSDLFRKDDGTPGIVKIEATGNRGKDFDLANQLLGLEETPDGYVWHHIDDYDVKNNTITLQLVKDEAHNAGKRHMGGCGQYDAVHGASYNPRKD